MEKKPSAKAVGWYSLWFYAALVLAVALWVAWWLWDFAADLFIVLWTMLLLSALLSCLAVFGMCERYMRRSGRFSKAERRKWAIRTYLFGPLACVAFARKYFAGDDAIAAGHAETPDKEDQHTAAAFIDTDLTDSTD